ncbi:MAG: DUF362 domain-containing protein [Acetobacteraceae bacterium]|nr:DUF362 domain-containing protein [Acetobacteraceae bacterium]
MPRALYELRNDALFIDLARLKLSASPGGMGYSLGLKNMFGLIPEPDRSDYHRNLPQSILDANLIYHALFDVVVVCEGLENVIVYRDDGACKAPWGAYDIEYRHRGLVVVGSNPLEVDAVAASLFGVDISVRALLQEAARFFPAYSEQAVGRARAFGREHGLFL